MSDKYDDEAEALVTSFLRMYPPTSAEIEAVAARLRADARIVTAILGRCADLLDADQFNNIEALAEGVEPTFNEVVNGLQAQLAQAQTEIASLKTAQPGLEQNLLFQVRAGRDEIATLRTQLAEAREVMRVHSTDCNYQACAVCAWLAANREGK